ncbi:anaerobic glycerol-3-phosphate dehydrogenase subunit A, partial [Escherichia sp. TWPC-MK]
AYSGVRPLVASDDDPSGRNVSRGIVLLDHAERDGLDGFITITGCDVVALNQNHAQPAQGTVAGNPG